MSGRVRAILAATVLGLAGVPATSIAARQSESQRLDAFFESVFQRDLARSPILQARFGLKEHQHQWDDFSERRQIENAALAREDLRVLRSFELARLTPDAQLSYRLFERNRDDKLKAFAWRRQDYLVTQMRGPHQDIVTTLLSYHPIATRSDAQAYIARLSGVAAAVHRIVSQLELQESAGVRPPAFVYDLVLGECESLIGGRPFDEGAAADSPLFADFKSKVDSLAMSAAERHDLTAQARAALLSGVKPGYGELIAHLRAARAAAGTEDGVWHVPDGENFYRYTLEKYTTLPVKPAELHELGLREVERIHAEMREILKRMTFAGTLQEFFGRLRTDAKFYYEDSQVGRERYLADARALLDRGREGQSRVLRLPPKVAVEIRAVEPWRAASAPKAFYSNPPIDGSRPGVFYINLHDMRAAPKYQLAAVLYHETIPGHHIETTVAQALAGLPRFRKLSGNSAFSEGWGMYAEQLAKEMGWYADPMDDFGRLTLELMRATRLVVDTGIHSMKWSRAAAIEYLDANMPSSHYDNQREVERYIVLPGQATAYTVGMLKILELRERARAALAERFDLRDFHEVVLGSGPLPLPMLEERVAAWIAAEGRRDERAL